ncbi:MAG: polysaccharide biosynthesis tyrosine autokinase [Candidatus Omnitrophica bacterium]|nr:polysaccharide biosynthesis tyrosine autokinase [Candidatus Omnitrophota bacterium]
MLPASEKELNIKDYLNIVKKNIWLVITCITVIPLMVAFYSFASPKIYQVSTSIVIEKESPNISKEVEQPYNSERQDKDYFQTQVEILSSRRVAKRVVKELELGQDVDFLSTDPVKKLLSMSKVELVRGSNMVILSVVGEDPLKITKIANVWARQFIAQSVERRVGASKYGVAWLEKQLVGVLQKLKEAEKDLNDFIKKNKIITNLAILEEKETLIDKLKSDRIQIKREIAEAEKRYKKKHPQMLSLRAKLESVENELENQREVFLLLQEKRAKYKVLQRKVDTYKILYTDLLKRAKELDISKEFTVSNIRVVDEAQEPEDPIKPKPTRDIFLAFFISVILGIGLSVFVESLDTTLKSSDDVENYADIPFLGYLASAKKLHKGKTGHFLINQAKSFSTVVEALRNIKISLLFSFPEDKPLKKLTITSTVPKEGKSFLAVNLAIIFAQAGEKILLIDADMRRGRLHKSLGVSREKGLSSVLTGNNSLDESIVSTSIPNLSFLPNGPATPNPTELLSSKRLDQILNQLEKKYKRIIIDSTPLLSVSEPVILGSHTDGLLFVINGDKTSYKLVNEAKKIVKNKVKIIGAVLNFIEKDPQSYNHYYYYSDAKT